MRKLATLRRIDSLTAIEGAEKIELAHTGGWQCVVGKGQFKPGELAIFFEIDSALDSNDPRYEFLKERCLKTWKLKTGELIDQCIRIRTIKCMGHISQGLFMPLSMFPEVPKETLEGDDLTALLNVRHYDELKEHADIVGGKAQIGGNAKGNFPVHLVPKTDEERLQNLTEYFETMKDVEFECTEKFDGSSATYIYAPVARPADPFFVCSRNLEIKYDPDNLYWQIAKKYDLLNRLSQFCWRTSESGYIAQVAIQGEIVGPGVNNNRDQYIDHEFRVFRMYNVTNQRWYDPLTRFCEVEGMGLQHVKVIRPRWKVFQDLKTMDDFLKFVQGKTDRGHDREGMVWKSMDGRISFKVINPEYLLKEK